MSRLEFITQEASMEKIELKKANAQRALDNFNYEAVAAMMKEFDWKWLVGYEPSKQVFTMPPEIYKIPNVKEIKEAARELMEHALESNEYKNILETGGLRIYKLGYEFFMAFNCDSYFRTENRSTTPSRQGRGLHA